MLDSIVVKKIEEFVYTKPRSVQEIASHIGKNWRTADRYIDEIEKEYGTIASRVFRGGTRGALKIAYWASIEKASVSVFQQQLEQKIFHGREREDFNGFEIYQHIADKKKSVLIKEEISEELGGLRELKKLLTDAKKQLLIFSGNLSFINFKDKEIDAFKVLEGIVKSGISLKIVSRVDITGRENVERMLALNHKYGKELVEIHHIDQPLRAIIVDNQYFNIKEIQKPTGRTNELDTKVYLFYDIYDSEWTEWISRIFWKMFSSSISAQVRLAELDKLKLSKHVGRINS